MNIIKYYDNQMNPIDKLFQWDSGVTIELQGINTTDVLEIHFCNRLSKEALRVPVTITGNTLTTQIPNVLLTQAETIIGYTNVVPSASSSVTKEVFYIPVVVRPKPSDYQYIENIDTISVAKIEQDIQDRFQILNDKINTALGVVASGSPKGAFIIADDLIGKEPGIYIKSLDGWTYYWDGETLSDPICVYQDGDISWTKIYESAPIESYVDLFEKIAPVDNGGSICCVNLSIQSGAGLISGNCYVFGVTESTGSIRMHIINVSNGSFWSIIKDKDANAFTTVHHLDGSYLKKTCTSLGETITAFTDLFDKIGYISMSGSIGIVKLLISNSENVEIKDTGYIDGEFLAVGSPTHTDGYMYLKNLGNNDSWIVWHKDDDSYYAYKTDALTPRVETLEKNSKDYVKKTELDTAIQNLKNSIPNVEDIIIGDDGKLHIVADGNIIGEGVEFPEGGTGFDSVSMDEGGYLHIQLEGEDVVDPVYIGTGGGGNDYGSTIRVANKLPSKSFTVMNTAEQVLILYSVTSLDSADQSPTGDCSVQWYVNGTRVAVETVPQGENSFDVKPYLKEGTSNTVKLYAEDSYGNNRSVTWTVKVTQYSLSWNLEEISNHGEESVNIRLVSNGTGSKIIHLFLDGEEVLTKSVNLDGGTTTYTVPAQAHGAHTITAYLEATVDGEALTTDELRHTGIWEESGNYTPIIAVFNDKITTKQFTTTAIKYLVYTPNFDTSAVQLKVGDTVVSELTVDRSVQTWAYKVTTVGTTNLSIVSGEAEEPIEITAESIGYDIAPVTEGLVLDINPEGHSNTETSRADFGYTDSDNVNHPFTFSDNFDWVNGGFQLDDEGVTAFVVKRGTYVMADRSLFNDDAKADGKQIKLIYKTAMVRDPSTEVISCMSGGIGLTMKAEEAVLSSELNTMSTPYCTDKKVEMDISIEPDSGERFACVYLKAIPSRGMSYDAGDRWTQSSPAMLKIGSEEADVWIYRIKMYSYALTRREILQNHIADCANPAEMVERYERNDVFNSDGSLDMTELSKKNPQLRVFHIKGDKMTTSKEDEVSVSVEMLYADGGDEHHFTAEGVIMKAQGTSSLEYIAAALNLDLDFSDATSWVNGKGEAITGYAFSDKAIPVDYFNLKADVASCEKTNNILNVERYHRFNPFAFKAKSLDNRVRDTIEGHPCAVFFTNTSSDTITVGDRTLASGATMLYFAGNMNNSKKNFEVFGQNNTTYPDQCCVEIMNNNALECRFKKNIGADETWKDGNFEFRFPKNPTDAMKERFKEVHSWVVSTDTAAATNESLGRTVDYGEKDLLGNPITYTADTAAYRKAKFIHEAENYFHTDNLDFHYLYTEFTCGVDNRAKNCFMSYEPDANDVWRWSFRTHYDHDTSYGNDNSGGLTFTYGLEDTDTVGNANVFNASDSVLWCNVRDFRSEELHEMYVSRESLGCWSADDILKEFNEYQKIRPEALEMEDAFNKYRVPSATRYRSMMLGSKEYQRAYFIPKQEVYMASKHRGNLCTQHKISLRTNVPEGSDATGDITGVVPFVDMYLRCKFGNVGEYVIRAKAGQTYTMICPEGANLNDLETYIFSSQHITHVGSLASVYPKFVDFSDAPLLRRAEIGSDANGYLNTSMNTANTGGINFDNNPYLEYIDLRNIPYLTQSLNLSKLTSLEEIYISESGITGVEFAKAAPVRIAILNTLKKLVARGLTRLEKIAVGYSALTSIWIEETPLIDTMAMVKAAKSLERGRLTDVSWEDESADVIMSLSTKAGFDEFGKDTERFVLKGQAHLGAVSQLEIDTIHSEFSDLDITYDTLLESFTVTFKDYDGTVLNTQTVRQYGSAVNPVTSGAISTPTREPSVDTVFEFIGWDKSFSNVESNLIITAKYSEKARTYNVYWWKDETETSLLYSKEGVEVYSDAEYEGETPIPPTGAIWMGWDRPSSNIIGDTNIHAVFVVPTLPDVVATDYDYLYSDDPADKSGYSLAEFYGIISAGVAKDYFAVGDKVKIVPVTDVFVDTEIVMQVYGFNHYKLSDGSGEFAKVVFGMLGLMNATQSMNSSNTNVGGWNATKMRNYLNNTIFPALPLQWQTMIKEVNVLSSEGNTSARIVTSADKLFLFSQAEVGFNPADVPYANEVDSGAEEVTFSLFTSNTSRIKKTYNGAGTAGHWWLRSPLASSSTHFCFVGNGGYAHYYSANGALGVAFGFCI